MNRISIFLVFLCSGLSLVAQKKTAPVKPQVTTNGRNINITLTPLKNCKVYLGSYMGKGKALVDSAMLNDKSQGVFRGANKLTGGIYFVVSPQLTIQFELLMDDKQHFSIAADTALKEQAVITGSFDNDLFKTYSEISTTQGKKIQQYEAAYHAARTSADSAAAKAELVKADKAIRQYQSDIIAKYPQSLLAMLFNTMKRPTAPAIPVVNGKADSLYPYRFVKEHFWDDVNFNDDRLLRTPFFELKLDEYFKYYVSPEPDSIIAEVKYILLYARTGKEIYPYLLTKFTNKYMNPEFMGQDKVFVYLFENFYAKGDTVLLNQASRKTVTERAYFLMANQIGQPAPTLNLSDTTGKAVSLYAIQAPFTMIAFWDPNCGHCKEEIPRLDSLYKAKWRNMGVKVLSVNIYENEIPSWKKFIAAKSLSSDWLQAYETKEAKEATEKSGQANYRQLFDIIKTPTFYLLDKDKHIIAKQLSLEQFDDILKIKTK
ncbi:Peroxiredoxin [Hydrobacter penzbergensis]|uniref:Peroxiredoxin n=1 Tax=Hydrobacter penzbergensis TaxID=1235997 RepID=A0A8X8II74_9BACT|nr:redoxin domain-containing protein [Hydrobacter penzbergensis]SDX56511.1 Peroxiredoxin [Hydrobacter penzbergensis]